MPLSSVCLDESEDIELRLRKGTFDVASFLSQTWERRQCLLFKTKLSKQLDFFCIELKWNEPFDCRDYNLQTHEG